MSDAALQDAALKLDRAREQAAAALRRFGHAVVGHEADTTLLLWIAELAVPPPRGWKPRPRAAGPSR
ncbi:MAG: hypothetical protein M3415_05155 [Actinomycetota bacterium]|nr:hypothetical protein [Actinomycetota bacterium]